MFSGGQFLHIKSYQFWLEVDQFILAKYAYIKSWAWSGILKHAQGVLK